MGRQSLGEMNGGWLRVFKFAHICAVLMLPAVLWCATRLVTILDRHDQRLSHVEQRVANVPDSLIPGPDLRRELEDIKIAQRELSEAVHRIDLKVTELGTRAHGSN